VLELIGGLAYGCGRVATWTANVQIVKTET
jgi:hypothetical protein